MLRQTIRMMTQYAKLGRPSINKISQPATSITRNKLYSTMPQPTGQNYKWILGTLTAGAGAYYLSAHLNDSKDSYIPGLESSYVMRKLKKCRCINDVDKFLLNHDLNSYISNFDELVEVLTFSKQFGLHSSAEKQYVNSVAISINKYVNTPEQFEKYLELTVFSNKQQIEIIKNKLPQFINNYTRIIALGQFIESNESLNMLLSLHDILKELPQKQLSSIMSVEDKNFEQFQQIYKLNFVVAGLLLNSMSDDVARTTFNSLDKLLQVLRIVNEHSILFYKYEDNLFSHLGDSHLTRLTGHLSEEEKQKLQKEFSSLISRQLFPKEKNPESEPGIKLKFPN